MSFDDLDRQIAEAESLASVLSIPDDAEEATLGSDVPTGVGFFVQASRQCGVEKAGEANRRTKEGDTTAHEDSFHQRL